MAYYSGDERESRSGGDDRPDSDLGDKPIHLMEHLATFTVTKESGIVYPADGMRKLLALEKTTGIWSQKMQVCLDGQWIIIMDYETGNVIERFPASLIQDPTAFTSNDPMEMYNNILVFKVEGGSHARSEMHIFQCQSISAVHLAEDLKLQRNGKFVQQHRDPMIPPQNHHQNSQHHHSNSRGMVGGGVIGGGGGQDTDSELGGMIDETSSTSSEKYERDVTVLNHCFDDIEKFIARLQHAAAASRELEKRRRNRKSKKKDPGEGLLTMRTRPPHEKEFIDILSKFKLSFNLLAKLKAHIHDPNAPELVHFLFTPLALIVDASHDTYYDPNLPARVIIPLLTREAINLLVNCVTSKETELWRSLGDSWTIPRDQWKSQNIIGTYHPVFFDGWSPDYPVIDELQHMDNQSISGGGIGGSTPTPSTPTNLNKRRMINSNNLQQMQHIDYADYDYDGGQPSGGAGHLGAKQANSPTLRDYSNRSEISIDSIERNGTPMVGGGGGGSGAGAAIVGAAAAGAIVGAAGSGNNNNNNNNDAWLDELLSRNCKVVQVTYPRTANNDKELTVVRGEYLEVLDDSRKWWKARNSRGQVAHVPHTIVTSYTYGNNGGAPQNPSQNDNPVFNNPIYSQNYNKSRQSNGGGNVGPNSSNERYDENSAATPDWVLSKHMDNGGGDNNNNNNNSISKRIIVPLKDSQSSQPPPPPPPLPPPTTPSTPTSRTNTISRKSIVSQHSNTGQDEVQEELKHVLTMFREKRRNLDISKTPDIYISQKSSAEDVKNWLVAKNFSEKTQKKLNGLTGNELFAIKRHTLEESCGPDEGKRLASQITVQRNVSGYKTARSSELQAILAKARQKTETE